MQAPARHIHDQHNMLNPCGGQTSTLVISHCLKKPFFGRQVSGTAVMMLAAAADEGKRAV